VVDGPVFRLAGGAKQIFVIQNLASHLEIALMRGRYEFFPKRFEFFLKKEF
jgi:hypothetical protein